MITQTKIWLRNRVPKRYQVPLKYLANAVYGRLEDEIRLLNFLVQPHQLVIDVGGNRGTYAYRLWQLRTKVVVFEPNPECASILKAWASNKPDLFVHAIALSNKEGKANLHIPIDDKGIIHDASASLEHTNFSKVSDQVVCIRTLDSFRFQQVGFIKIDVEGHEFDVVLGAEETLRTSKPSLLIEIEQRHSTRRIQDIFRKFDDMGYSCYYLGAKGLLIIDNFDVVKDQNIDNFYRKPKNYINNFLFLHKAKLKLGEYKSLFMRHRA